jgi:hypothetical protein
MKFLKKTLTITKSGHFISICINGSFKADGG